MTILRGAIDFVSPERISGWIYSELTSVKDHTVLALLDGQCVGASQIAIFRQDLAEAGLGDGFLGFEMDISVPRHGDEARVVVKLDGSDAVLLQLASRVTRADEITGVTLPSFRFPSSLEWMRSRGWLDQMEIDLFKAVDQFGVYDRSLKLNKVAEKVAGTPLLDPQQEARLLFELLRMQRVNLKDYRMPSIGALAEQRVALAASTPEPVIGLWSAKRSSFLIVEGSHRDDFRLNYGLSGAVQYALGPDRLLLLDLRCRFGVQYEKETADLRAFLVSEAAISNLGL